MSKELYISEQDDKKLAEYLTQDKDLMKMSSKGTVRNVSRQVIFNGVSLDEMFDRMFNGKGAAYNLQNKMLVTMIYGSAGENPYMDDMLVSFIQGIHKYKPKTRENQNKLLKAMADNIDTYAPYSDKLGTLGKYVDYCINANNKIMSCEGLSITEERIGDKIQKEKLDTKISENFKEAKKILGKNGWDLSIYPEDEELLRCVFNLEREGTKAGHQVYCRYVSSVLSAKVHNAVDRDNVYKEFKKFLHDNNYHQYKNIEQLDNFIDTIRYTSCDEVEMCRARAASASNVKNKQKNKNIKVMGR